MARLPVDELVDELGRIYRRAERELEAQVAAALRSGALGTASYRQAQLAEVRAMLGRLQSVAIPQATAIVGSAYAHGARAAEAALKLGAGAFGASIHQDAVEVLADNLTNRLNEATLNVGRKVDDLFRREGLAVAAQGLVQGATRRQVSAELAETLAGQGVRAFEDRAGREWGLETYSKMAARTTTREAVSHGTANRLLETGQDLVTISSHIHDEDVCSGYDGQTFSLTGTTEGYPVLDQLPPFHPNCIHVVTPAEANLEEAIAELEKAETLEDAEKAIGVGETLETPAAVREAVQDAVQGTVTGPAQDPVLGALQAASAALESGLEARGVQIAAETLEATGVPVRAKLALQSERLIPDKVKAELEQALEAAAKLHRLPNDAPVAPIVMGGAPRGARGAYVSTAADATKAIRLARLADERASTLAHEIGHFVDHKLIPGEIGFTSEEAFGAELLADFKAATQGSESVRALRTLRQGVGSIKSLNGTTSAPVPAALDYLLDPSEVWARAYRQWVAIRSGNSVLLHELRQEQHLKLELGVGYPDLWSDKDFEPIAEAFDAIFKKRGLR